MSKVRDYFKLANDIVKEVGGKENIVNATRCATRLRLVLHNTPSEAKDKISKMTGVISVVEQSGQFQVVIGTHVGEVFEAVSELVGLETGANTNISTKGSVLSKIIASMSAIFAPFVYILAAAGILQGFLIITTMINPSFASSGTYEVLSFMSWTPFTFLPIFIAVTASRHFKCNTYIALVCCCALVNPSWADIAGRVASGESISFLFFNLPQTTYTGSVLPPIFLVWILSYFERFVEKISPSSIKPLVTPFVCLLVMVPFTILLLGPISTIVANSIAGGYNNLYNTVPMLAAALIGGFWQVVVIFGVHWASTPLSLTNFSTQGYDSFQAYQTIAVVAQTAAAFGVFFKTRNKDFKGVAASAGITGIFGITEPAIYGVTLRLKKPFICGCIAGAVGSIVASLFNTVYYTFAGLPSIITVINASSPSAPMSLIGEVIGCLIAIIGSIVLVRIVGFDEPTN